MRLTCPNCGAQYEVPDQVIPEEGRDVQCSNCGMTWFHAHPDNPQPETHTPEVDVADRDEDRDSTRQEAEESWKDRPDESFSQTEPASEEGSSPEPDEVRSGDALASEARSGIDSDVAEVLRQEAEREAQLRAEESAGGLESQPELGLDNEPDDATRRLEEARARMARLRGDASASQPASTEPDLEEENVNRRGLLPDIEEINSSLKSSTAVAPALPRSEADNSDRMPPRGGFSRGFALVLLLGAILLLVYTNASRISAALPQADPALNAYVAAVDNARTWLNQQLANLTPKS